MNKTDKIFVTGHTGLIGTALVNRLRKDGYTNLLLRTSSQLDLTDQRAVTTFFRKHNPSYVFLLAAKVGGIAINDKKPVMFIHDNLMIECNVIESAYRTGIKNMLYLACGCIYPKQCKQPIKEEYMLDGKPEQTNLATTIAKIAGVILCQSYNKQYGTNYISCAASNVFGPNDNFDLGAGHVIPNLVRKFFDAKLHDDPAVTVWGSGKPARDFIYVDDVVDALVFLARKYRSADLINIGTGQEVSIKQLALMIKSVTGYNGKLLFDKTKPDGMLKKLMDTAKLTSLGWKPKIGIKQGLEKTCRWYKTERHECA
jgi:GDP-L-fucose synthase